MHDLLTLWPLYRQSLVNNDYLEVTIQGRSNFILTLLCIRTLQRRRLAPSVKACRSFHAHRDTV